MGSELSMNLSIASGKGGTGKTFVAINLACSLEQEINLLDCDVEEPNLHLFLHPTITNGWDVSLKVPEVVGDGCTLCKRCVEVCSFQAITLLHEDICIFPELCHGCGSCILFCPEGVLKERRHNLGVVEEASLGSIHFYQGILNPGEPLAPPVIRSVKERGGGERDTILDAPPGTSCSAVETLRGSDYVLLVTEPTPFGLHDLELAVLLCKKMDLPCGILLNRSDIGDECVKEFARERGIPILLTIPYSQKIALTCARGEILVWNYPSWREIFLRLWERIREELRV